MVGVNDIFNQNKAFARSTGSGWTQNSTNSVIGRYYMVQFTYNLRRFGKKGSKTSRITTAWHNLRDRAAWGPAARAALLRECSTGRGSAAAGFGSGHE